LALLTTAIGLLVFVQPAAAFRVTHHGGVTGDFYLEDQQSAEGAHCDYRFSNGEYELFLMTVHAPSVYAVSGVQRVGWQYTVQRQLVSPGSRHGWENRVTSKIIKGLATTSERANFTYREVKVIVPFSEIEYYRYRVILRLFWYASNGSLTGTATGNVEWYREFQPDVVRKGYCQSYE